ncbi:hypothetical protein [Pseudomonas guariconensis]|uniref:hypothetical protein n=1 Tax=Pseudomonas guariconensis TaxID=1288410 RepID=UPI003905BC6B
MPELKLDIPVTIAGEDVIIIRDVLGSDRARVGRSEVLTLLEPAGSDGRPPIYVDESVLSRTRENYPSTNVYGLWQLLFANDRVPLGSPLVVFPTGEAAGEILMMELGTDFSDPVNILRSSEYSGNYFPEQYGGYDLDQGQRIVVDTDQLLLPDTPAYTRLELSAKQQSEQSKRWYVTISVCVAIAFAFGAYNYAMDAVFRLNMNEYASKKQLNEALAAREQLLLSERLLKWPNDGEIISRIGNVVAYDPKVTTPVTADAANGFPSRHVLLTRENFQVDLSSRIPGVRTELLPTMNYRVTVMPTGQEVPN